MDVRKIYDLFKVNWEHLDFQLTNETNDTQAVFATNMESKSNFSDDVYVKVVAFDTGTVHVFFTFDNIEYTLENLKLINELNEATSWLKGYITRINGEDFFEVHYSFYDAPNEEKAVAYINHAMTDLLKDGILELVSKVCRHTHR